MIRRLLPLLLVLGVVLGVAPASLAQELPAEPVVTVGELQVGTETVGPGDLLELSVQVDVADGYHVYSVESEGVPTTFALVETPWLEVVELRESPAPHEVEIDPALPLELHHEGRILLTLVARVGDGAKPGTRTVKARVGWMACTDEFCFEPTGADLRAQVEVSEAPAGATLAEPTEERPGVVTSVSAERPAAPGGTATLVIELATLPGWYFYDQRHAEYYPPTFEWELPEGFTATALRQVTEPVQKKQEEWEDEPFFVFKEGLTLEQTIEVGDEVEPGTYDLAGTATFQACKEACIQLDQAVVARLVVLAQGAGTDAGAADGGDSGSTVSAPPPKASGGEVAGQDDLTASGISAPLLLQAMLWGFLTILTPCVFPLIPVSVSFFSKQEGPALPLATVFATGIVFTITVIGLIFSASLDAIAASWYFNAAMALIFFALALSLFGLYDLRMPGFLINRASAGTSKGGYAGALFMGITLALTSFSCSMPFLAFMFQGFERGNHGAATVGLLVYSGTMAAPFFFGALFPSMLQKLPRSGGWLNAVKVTMGFVELALVFKFLRGIFDYFGNVEALPRQLVLAVWIACALGATLYLLGYITLPHDTKTESIGVVRMLFALLFLSFAGYLLPGLFGRSVGSEVEGFILTKPSELTLASAGSGGAGHEEFHWPVNEWDEALVRADARDQLVLIDFTGTG